MIDFDGLQVGQKYMFLCESFRVRGKFSSRSDGFLALSEAFIFLTESDTVDYIRHDILRLRESLIRDVQPL